MQPRGDIVTMRTLIAFGDSLTAPRTVEGRELSIYADLLRKELPARGFQGQVLKKGIGGNTTMDAMARFDRDVMAHDPDAVIFLFGMNDSAIDTWKSPPATGPRVPLGDFIGNLSAMAGRVRSRGGRVILATPNPRRWGPEMRALYGKPPYDVRDPMGFNHLYFDYVQAVRELAAREGMELADLYRLCVDYDGIPGRSMDDLHLDGIHLNDAGHRLLADALLEILTGNR